jgi:hypothetical protein
VHLGVEQSLAISSALQKDQYNELQIQQMRNHSEFVTQLRISESRKRPWEDTDAHFPHRRRAPYAAPPEQYGLYDNRGHIHQGNGAHDGRPPLSNKGWHNWSREDVRGWIIEKGCPVLAAALFPPVGSPAPPLTLSSGQHLQHLNKFLDKIGGDTLDVKFERLNLDTALKALLEM